MINLYWNSADKAASIHMGEYTTPADAVAAMKACAEELCEQCSTASQRAGVADGHWTVEADETLLMNPCTGTVLESSHWQADGFTPDNADLKEVKWYGDYWVEV